MIERDKPFKCFKCGGDPEIYCTGFPVTEGYFVRCRCGNRGPMVKGHMMTDRREAVDQWNIQNVREKRDQ